MAGNNESAPLHSTRQMLDELDALMERMLALPVNEPDESPPPAPPRSVAPTPTVRATLTLVAPSTEPALLPAPGVRDVVDPAHPFPPPSHLPGLGHRHLDLDPRARPEPFTNQLMPPSVLPRIEAALAQAPEMRPVRPHRLFTWLLWSNQTFDALTRPLGGPGEWLCDRAGRTWLGLLGFIFLALGALWLLSDWRGWTG